MIKLLGFLSILIFMFSCKKEIPERPVNYNENAASNTELNCATCPSSFYTISQTSSCDDFTSNDWPQNAFNNPGDTIGFTQNQTQLVQVALGGLVELNSSYPGIYFFGPIDFAFTGDEQTVSFNIYGYYSQYNQYGFGVNGSAISYLDGVFPMTIGGATVDLDTTITDIPGFENAILTFSGAIGSIDFEGFESGITEVCVTHAPDASNNPAFEAMNFVNFIDDFGNSTGPYPSAKTPLGYFSLQGASMLIDFEQFLGYEPTKISFVHSHPASGSNLLNVQLPGTPLIVASPNELEVLLSGYGYQTEIYSNPNGLMWEDELSPPIAGMQVDSIVIQGENLSMIQIGANMIESELRSICSYY